ncbi:MAG TPA: UdgX family uracil-DNA binding protein [Brevundimonas sp.]|jgi:DNA polymerase|uniref:UdgX family uracil-DNA binding protein n=1 Tax=Brevundimonas sp. TaxID=1871086 RepID=UPI002E1077A9|nr:UdgX family uracil-DNA binding protein [Brevundimonas sp.]HEV7354293.1 UdgX family uracil-DNA binding protein [Brevundimonas sp.]
MRRVSLAHATDFDGWRAAARRLRLEDVEPARVRFETGGTSQAGLFDEPAAPPSPPPADAAAFVAPRALVELGQLVALHRSEDRFDLLYRLLWRLQAEPRLLQVASDPDVADAMERAKNVRRAAHKMKAFVRFREVDAAARTNGEAAWVAWFEPAHRVLELTAPFFVRRFTTMDWLILTPDGRARWDGAQLSFGPPAARDMAPDGDELEDFWRTYYAATFNPARLRVKAMQTEMPKRYWRDLPEAALIPELISRAGARTEAMVTAAPAVPNARLARAVKAPAPAPVDEGAVPGDLADIADGLERCRRCPLWRDATRAVPGEGGARARLMLVGEQPGDEEDLSGKPFVGPAGQVLNAALAEAGLARGDLYVTNAVKHFKHEPRGKRRLHRSPDPGEVGACGHWLAHERRLIRPRIIVALGATAALAILGRRVPVAATRGQPLAGPDGATVVVTWHPSYILRTPDAAAQAAARAALADDLRLAARLAA